MLPIELSLKVSSGLRAARESPVGDDYIPGGFAGASIEVFFRGGSGFGLAV